MKNDRWRDDKAILQGRKYSEGKLQFAGVGGKNPTTNLPRSNHGWAVNHGVVRA